jgi:hypothetical protein
MNMDSSAIVALLGKHSDSTEVDAFLKSVSAPSPKLPKGDQTTYSEVPESGLQLVFTDESTFTGDNELAIGEGALILSCVFFMGSEPDYQRYADPLPYGVRFDMDRKELERTLGTPEWSDDELCTARWDKDGLKFSVKYADDFASVENCGVQKPGANDDFDDE